MVDHIARLARPCYTLLAIAGLTSLIFVGESALAQRSGTAQRPRESEAGRHGGTRGSQVSLQDQLRVGLKAFTKQDFAFIDAVVELVDQGKLPRRLVDSTFLWARDRAARRPGPRRLRPMVYFRPALTFRARAFGIRL